MTNVGILLRHLSSKRSGGGSSSVLRRRVQALSIAPSARAWLRRTTGARVLHVFDRACNLINADGDILSLVSPEVGEGPFAIVVAIDSAFSDLLDVDSTVAICGEILDVGSISVDVAGSQIWQPRPGWEKARERLPALHDHILSLADLPHPPTPSHEVDQHILPHPPTPSPEVEPPKLREGRQHTSGEGERLLPSPDDSCSVVRRGVGGEAQTRIAHAALPAIEALCAGVATNNLALCRAGARGLAGLGSGLTPAGDDVLLGAMYAIWVIYPDEEAAVLSRAIAETAAPLTTHLSAAWLRAAARGEAGRPWHALVDGLAAGERDAIVSAARRILNMGHTSGADALAGFVATVG